MTRVIIAEKPSVAKNIADALNIKNKKDGYFEGNGYLITWAFGHLLQLYDAKDYDLKMARWDLKNFPFIPSAFQYKIKSSPKDRDKEDSGAKKQLKIIYSLMKRPDVKVIISACDFDREGQIIGDTIINSLKVNKPIARLLLNEWTQDEVVKGLNQLRSNAELKPLQDAGISRQWADWVIGINLTSVATLKYQLGKGSALNIGRVLLPTLKIIYDREKEIEKFKPETYFKLSVLFRTKQGEEYEGTYFEKGKDKFTEKEKLLKIKQLLSKHATLVDKEVDKKREFPPSLFNLSNLQGYITSKYRGWNSSKVLKVAQALYEKKHITYPRTGSTVLEESLVGKAAKVLEKVKGGLPFENEVRFTKSKRVFNTAKVESHSAIIPTYVLPKSLTKDEEIVYTAIKNRFIMQFMPIAEYEETKLTTRVFSEHIDGVFVSKGRVQLVEGWKKVERVQTKDSLLPQLAIKDNVEVVQPKIGTHETKPPKLHTEKTLLRLMETCGKGLENEESEEMLAVILSGYSIGTPATRAETIKKLTDVGYIVPENKTLRCTELGKRLVETFPIRELFDLEFTGRLEKTLADIEKQKFTKESFLEVIFDFTTKAVETIKSEQAKIINEVTPNKKSLEVLGKCPLCGEIIIEGKKGFGCSGWKKGCKFVIWKNDKFLASMKKKPTKTMVKTLLKFGSVTVKGLTSKKGNKFDAILRYEKSPDNDYFNWKMEFKK
ncbi:type IA DNA topoisomerase [Bacillus solitudinis]|uniref:type IA DNA topoisomerase n=1 Tax=Bacillus solitudinis TaxID=2014074 RepID=UPI000C24702E|nr:type IA DNA topoisomerase [Bacillus solitudinis]